MRAEERPTPAPPPATEKRSRLPHTETGTLLFGRSALRAEDLSVPQDEERGERRARRHTSTEEDEKRDPAGAAAGGKGSSRFRVPCFRIGDSALPVEVAVDNMTIDGETKLIVI